MKRLTPETAREYIRQINSTWPSEQRRAEEKLSIIAYLLADILESLSEIVQQGVEAANRDDLAESVRIYGGPSERFDAALHKGGRP